MSGDEEKSGDLHQSFAASHLGSLTGSCKREDRQLLGSLGEDRPLPTDQLLHSLNWQSVLLFLKEAVVCVCLVWKRSIFVQYSSEDGACLVWGKICLPLVCREGVFFSFLNQHRETSVLTIGAITQYNPTLHHVFCCRWGCVGLWGRKHRK